MVTNYVPVMDQAERLERRRTIARRISEGDDPDLVSGDLGISQSLMRESCREFGVPYPTKPGPRERVRGRTFRIIGLLIKTDWRLGEIAHELNCSLANVSRVYNRCLEHGIPVKERKRGRG